MRLKRVFLGLMMTLLAASTVFAFSTSGQIEKLPGFRYTDLKVQGNQVYATIHNDTKNHVRFIGRIIFTSMSDYWVTNLMSGFIPAGNKATLTTAFENTPQRSLPGGASMQWVELGAYEAN